MKDRYTKALISKGSKPYSIGNSITIPSELVTQLKKNWEWERNEFKAGQIDLHKMICGRMANSQCR